MVSYNTRMPLGIPGRQTRNPIGQQIETKYPAASGYPDTFGNPVAVDSSGNLIKTTASTLGSDVYGFLVANFPFQLNVNEALDVQAVPTTGALNVLKSGYIAVAVRGTTAPAPNGKVYVRTGNAGTNKVVGGIEAAADIAIAAVAGTNTGNPTFGTASATEAAISGDYILTFLTATTFRVEDPNFQRLKDGATGAAYTAQGVTFTMTAGGTPAVAGDKFTITVTRNTQLIPNAFFTGTSDNTPANGVTAIAEIAYNV